MILSLPTLIAELCSFFLVWTTLYWYVVPHVLKNIDRRRKQINASLQSIEHGEDIVAAAQKKAESILSKASKQKKIYIARMAQEVEAERKKCLLTIKSLHQEKTEDLNKEFCLRKAALDKEVSELTKLSINRHMIRFFQRNMTEEEQQKFNKQIIEGL